MRPVMSQDRFGDLVAAIEKTGYYPQVVAGAVLVALLAVVLDLLLAGVQRYLVSPGVSGRVSTRRTTSNQGALPASTQER